jgi:hypothetical protein
MSEYAAQLVTNIVTEIIVGNYVWANDNLDGDWVDCTNDGELIAGVGYTYDADTKDFVAPVIAEVVEP